ncbi:hypothetical protein [Bradyrhizobium sp. SZCCHNRI1001]|uniref:hypothetical protein n=1 Tax=Bradyrhizobium sp. SZCCHNRI1001 TaxID=3057273 RepID=UPI0028EF48F6|nr:hypothetical protein [Bradyrhizobium sp. SZCCHNRI1001]
MILKILVPELIRFNLDRQKSSNLPDGYRFGEFKQNQWREVEAVLREAKLLDGPVDLERAVTFRFIQARYHQWLL